VSVTSRGLEGEEASPIGRRTTMTVPNPLELMSSVPPSCLGRSRMPRIPTPACRRRTFPPSFPAGCLCLVLDLDQYLTVALAKANPGERTSRMSVDVGEAFLHHAKDSGLRLTRQAAEVLGRSKSTLILLRRANPSTYQRRAEHSPLRRAKGMQQVRNGADFSTHFID